MAELELLDVDKVYRARAKAPVRAVNNLTLAVRSGEITALLGSSGCGKTSTLRMIAGFEEVSAGAIKLGGRVIHTLAPAQRGVAMAFEAYSLYPPLTIRENISFALKSARLRPAESAKRVEAMAELLEISEILDKYPSSVSGGQQQRASLGRALVRPAALYLLDEPMGQLEPQLRATLRGRIKHYLREHACTTILVTHDQTEANALADRIAVMEDGELQQYASPAELKARPANLFTGTFIGEPPMNVLPARVVVADGQVRFEIEDAGQALAFGSSELADTVRERVAALKRVVVGIRPHGLKTGTGPLRAKVISSQWLGDQTHVASEIAGHIVVSVSHYPLHLQMGEDVALSVQARELHLFDPETGLAIAHGNEPA